MTRNRGFTLAEIIIVLVIIAAMSALAIPRLSPLLDKEDLKAAARALSLAIADARERAMLDNEPWGLVLDIEDGVYWAAPLSRLDAAANAQTLLDSGLAKTLPGNIRFKRISKRERLAVETGRTVLGFLPLGLSEPCALTLVAPANEERILVLQSFSGRLKTAENDAEAFFLLGFDPEKNEKESGL